MAAGKRQTGGRSAGTGKDHFWVLIGLGRALVSRTIPSTCPVLPAAIPAFDLLHDRIPLEVEVIDTATDGAMNLFAFFIHREVTAKIGINDRGATRQHQEKATKARQHSFPFDAKAPRGIAQNLPCAKMLPPPTSGLTLTPTALLSLGQSNHTPNPATPTTAATVLSVATVLPVAAASLPS